MMLQGLICALFFLSATEARYQRTKLALADQLRQNFLQLEARLWADLENADDNERLKNESPSKPPEVNLLAQIEMFGDKMEKAFPHDLRNGIDVLLQSWFWDETELQLRSIYALYEAFRRFQTQQTAEGRVPAPQRAWLDFTESVLKDPTFSIIQSLQALAEIVDENNLFIEALKEMDNNAVCNSQESPQQILYNLYNTVAVTELKGYTMVQFSYMLLKLYGKGNFTKEAELSKARFKERSLNTIKAVKNVMSKASRELWRCEPHKQIAGKTYIELTQVLQGYIQNEVDLNPEGTCRENCAEYSYTKSHSCFQNLYCRQQRRCKGKILKCQFIDSDMWICPSNATTHRRYDYIEYENGRVLGRKQNCPKGRINVESWWRWLFWHCSYCLCICDEEGIFSDRYISLRTAASNFSNNRVVTGLRFAKLNRMIHLQVQEGELLSQGVINKETIRWVPVKDFQLSDHDVYSDQDYHTFTWENRAIDLDDVYAHEGHIVIGVRFKKIGSHINFEILVTPFDFETGQLMDPSQRGIWLDNVNSNYNMRKKLNLVRPDVPIRAIHPAQIDSKSGMYLEFTNTDIDKDAAQTTVPFFDAQNVDSVLAVPLAGAGIYHKGQDGFGGYIAPKIITYDYSSHLMSSLDMNESDGEEGDVPAN